MTGASGKSARNSTGREQAQHAIVLMWQRVRRCKAAGFDTYRVLITPTTRPRTTTDSAGTVMGSIMLLAGTRWTSEPSM